MATDYRFTGTNVDITLITDAPPNVHTFFVTDKMGEDPTDIMNGIDIGIEEFTEADFINIATTNSVSLFRYDRAGECCLVMQGAPAGVFNGTSSVLTVNDVTLGNGTDLLYPITFRVTYRINEEIFDRLLTGETFTIFSSDQSESEYFYYQITTGKNDDVISRFEIVPNTGNSVVVDGIIPLQPNMCNNIEITLTQVASTIINGVARHNGNQYREVTQGNAGLYTETDFEITYGGLNQGSTVNNRFSGIMRNLEVITSGGTEVAIINPATGTNTGTAGDGTATDITSISVIT